ncbi:Transcription factor tau subunit sfc6, partial [Zancudomyces culisetae]
RGRGKVVGTQDEREEVATSDVKSGRGSRGSTGGRGSRGSRGGKRGRGRPKSTNATTPDKPKERKVIYYDDEQEAEEQEEFYEDHDEDSDEYVPPEASKPDQDSDFDMGDADQDELENDLGDAGSEPEQDDDMDVDEHDDRRSSRERYFMWQSITDDQKLELYAPNGDPQGINLKVIQGDGNVDVSAITKSKKGKTGKNEKGDKGDNKKQNCTKDTQNGTVEIECQVKDFEAVEFKNDNNKETRVANTNLLIRAMDWCPQSDETCTSFLAVGGIKKEAEVTQINGRPFSAFNQQLSFSSDGDGTNRGIYQDNVIQIWQYNETALRLRLVIVHDRGAVWGLKWCPLRPNNNLSDYFSMLRLSKLILDNTKVTNKLKRQVSGFAETNEIYKSNKYKHIGILAAMFGDGTAAVFVVPHPNTISTDKQTAEYINMPVLLMDIRMPGTTIMKLEWLGCDRIVTFGYNGSMAIWSVSSHVYNCTKDLDLVEAIPPHNSQRASPAVPQLYTSTTCKTILSSSALPPTALVKKLSHEDLLQLYFAKDLNSSEAATEKNKEKSLKKPKLNATRHEILQLLKTSIKGPVGIFPLERAHFLVGTTEGDVNLLALDLQSTSKPTQQYLVSAGLDYRYAVSWTRGGQMALLSDPYHELRAGPTILIPGIYELYDTIRRQESPTLNYLRDRDEKKTENPTYIFGIAPFIKSIDSTKCAATELHVSISRYGKYLPHQQQKNTDAATGSTTKSVKTNNSKTDISKEDVDDQVALIIEEMERMGNSTGNKSIGNTQANSSTIDNTDNTSAQAGLVNILMATTTWFAQHRSYLTDIATSEFHQIASSTAADGSVILSDTNFPLSPNFPKHKAHDTVYNNTLYTLEYHPDENTFVYQEQKRYTSPSAAGIGASGIKKEYDNDGVLYDYRVSINCSAWHSSLGSCHLLASGSSSGLLRVDNLDY